MSRRILAPLAVAALVAGATTATSMAWPVLPREPARAGRPANAPVIERTLVCPDVSGRAGRVSARVSVAALPDPGRTGRAAATGLRGSFAVPLPVVATAGAAKTVDVTVAGGVARVDAGGPLAAGVAAELVTRTYRGPARGLAETRCPAASPDTWFVGGSTRPGASTSLLLVNPDDVAATANVSLLTANGPVAPRSAQGIEVAARSSLSLALESLAPDVPALATHVVVIEGRLAATVVDRRHRAELPLGVDYVPPVAAPARSAVVPGIAGGPGPRVVSIAVPGAVDATVELRVVSTEGSFVPASLNAVRVRAGAVGQVDLATVLAGQPAAVVVTSDEPVIASGFAAQSNPLTHGTDFAWTGATPSLGGPALIPDNWRQGLRLARGVLLLTAPGAGGTVALTALGSGPATSPVAAGPVTVRVPAGRTIAVPLVPPAFPPGEYGLVVAPAPGSGPVYGSREVYEQWSQGIWLSQFTLERTEATVRVPVVVEDPAAGVP